MAFRFHSLPWYYDEFDALNTGLDDFARPMGTSLVPHAGRSNSLINKRPLEMMNALKVDVVESENAWTVNADLPGVDMKDVDLQVANGALHISAQRSQKHEEKTEYSHRIERSFGQVKRSIPLPENALADTADAHFENGVLSVTFDKKPMLENNAPRKLSINSKAHNASEFTNNTSSIATNAGSNSASASDSTSGSGSARNTRAQSNNK